MLEEMSAQMPKWIRERFPSDPRSAVDFLREFIDEGMLREIAEADYAKDTEQHLQSLKPVWSGGEFKELDSWFPMEVLELMRWSEPEDPEWKPGSPGIRGHQIRAFCCAVLLATPNFEPEKETLIQMLDSVFVLGRDATEATGRFLTWRIESLEREQDRPFFALAIAAIIHSLEPDLSVADEESLADWVRDEEASEREYLAGFRSDFVSAPWLFGLSFSDMRNAKWEALIGRIRDEKSDRPLGRLLAGEQKA